LAETQHNSLHPLFYLFSVNDKSAPLWCIQGIISVAITPTQLLIMPKNRCDWVSRLWLLTIKDGNVCTGIEPSRDIVKVQFADANGVNSMKIASKCSRDQNALKSKNIYSHLSGLEVTTQ